MAVDEENNITLEQATQTTKDSCEKYQKKKNTVVATLSIIKRTHRTKLEHGVTGLLEFLLYTGAIPRQPILLLNQGLGSLRPVRMQP
jgi:hypothetical protein